MSAPLLARMKKELQMLHSSPPPGVCVWPVGDSITQLGAQIEGPEGTPFAGGVFQLDIVVPDRYPFEPPKVRFLTPVYHPNIDSGGRICLDTLKMPPKGAWRPSLNLSTLLTTLRVLLSAPNADDALVADIASLFQSDRAQFDRIAREWTLRHAVQVPGGPGAAPTVAGGAAAAAPEAAGAGGASSEAGTSESESGSTSGESSSDDDVASSGSEEAQPNERKRAAQAAPQPPGKRARVGADEQ